MSIVKQKTKLLVVEWNKNSLDWLAGHLDVGWEIVSVQWSGYQPMAVLLQHTEPAEEPPKTAEKKAKK